MAETLLTARSVREAVVAALLPVPDGRVPVPQGAALAAVPDLAALQPFQTWPQA